MFVSTSGGQNEVSDTPDNTGVSGELGARIWRLRTQTAGRIESSIWSDHFPGAYPTEKAIDMSCANGKDFTN